MPKMRTMMIAKIALPAIITWEREPRRQRRNKVVWMRTTPHKAFVDKDCKDRIHSLPLLLLRCYIYAIASS